MKPPVAAAEEAEDTPDDQQPSEPRVFVSMTLTPLMKLMLWGDDAQEESPGSVRSVRLLRGGSYGSADGAEASPAEAPAETDLQTQARDAVSVLQKLLDDRKVTAIALHQMMSHLMEGLAKREQDERWGEVEEEKPAVRSRSKLRRKPK